MWKDQNAPGGNTNLKMTSNAIFEMDFDIELKWRLIQTIWKDSTKFLKDWKKF